MKEKLILLPNDTVELFSNVYDIRKFILGADSACDFSLSLKRPLIVKSYEGSRFVGDDQHELYRLSGGLVKELNGVYTDIEEFLIPVAAILTKQAGPGPSPRSHVPNDYCIQHS